MGMPLPGDGHHFPLVRRAWQGYYRIAGKCEKCPNNAWVMIMFFLIMIVVLAAAGYILNRNSVNIAFLSIGIDYFQVLAMFSRSNIAWPPGA